MQSRRVKIWLNLGKHLKLFIYLFAYLSTRHGNHPLTWKKENWVSTHKQPPRKWRVCVCVCVCVLAKSQLFCRYNSMTRKKGKQTGWCSFTSAEESNVWVFQLRERAKTRRAALKNGQVIWRDLKKNLVFGANCLHLFGCGHRWIALDFFFRLLATYYFLPNRKIYYYFLLLNVVEKSNSYKPKPSTSGHAGVARKPVRGQLFLFILANSDSVASIFVWHFSWALPAERRSRTRRCVSLRVGFPNTNLSVRVRALENWKPKEAAISLAAAAAATATAATSLAAAAAAAAAIKSKHVLLPHIENGNLNPITKSETKLLN